MSELQVLSMKQVDEVFELAQRREFDAFTVHHQMLLDLIATVRAKEAEIAELSKSVGRWSDMYAHRHSQLNEAVAVIEEVNNVCGTDCYIDDITRDFLAKHKGE